MGDDIQLQKAIYESFRSSGSSSSSGAGGFRSAGGGSSFMSSSRSGGTSSSNHYLRSSARHPTSNASASRTYKSRSSALQKEGILPARKGKNAGGRTSKRPGLVKQPAVSATSSSSSSSSSSSAQACVRAELPQRQQIEKQKQYGHPSDVHSAVLTNLTKRFGDFQPFVVRHGDGGDGGGGESCSGKPCGRWEKVFGNGGKFKWCRVDRSENVANARKFTSRGCLESSTSSQLCIIRYLPNREEDPSGHGALEHGGDGHPKGIRVQMKFKCAHAAPASGHVPAFHLPFLTKVIGKEKMQMMSLLVDTKERCFAIEVHQIRLLDGSTSKVRTLHTFACRELRPGVYNTLLFECKLVKGDSSTSESRCGDGGAAEITILGNEIEVVQCFRVEDKWLEDQVQPFLGLGVCKSKLEWDCMDIDQAGEGSAHRVITRFRHADMSLVQVIEEEMLEIKNPITFDDIASLKTAKELLNEAVTLPLLIPEFFVGIREPWKGVLLFGPPGTGKTLLAKAVASMSDITFFNCSSSAMTSKWRGESEKLCKVLFQMARHYAPSIIFFDEVDAQVSQRGQDGEHEASRRFKSELLSQMDGVTSGDNSNGKNVIVLATSNCPWDVDEAMRRRLEKRIYIPLPDTEARRDMFKIYLKSVVLSSDVHLDELVTATEGFSGADIKLLCRDASMMPMRRAILNKSPEQIRQMKLDGQLQNDKQPLLQQDFEKALAKVQPSVSAEAVKRYEAWDREFASV